MKRLLITGTVAVLLLAGCGADGTTSPQPTVTVTETITAEPDPVDVVEDELDGEPVDVGDQAEELAFGEPVDLDGRIRVTVSEPRQMSADEVEGWVLEDDEIGWGFPVTMENIGSEPTTTDDLMMSLTVGSRSGTTLQSDPMADILPGRQVEFEYQIAAPAEGEMILAVDLFLGDETAFYVR